MEKITLVASVGLGGENRVDDVLVVQKALNRIAGHINLPEHLNEDGDIGEESPESGTCRAIGLFQRHIVGYRSPDFRIDASGQSIKKLIDAQFKEAISSSITEVTEQLFSLKVTPVIGLSDADYQHAAEILECDVAAIQAVSAVESAGKGFFASEVPCLLFEAHQFSKFTAHQHDESFPDISSRKWNRTLYLGGEKEYIRLNEAMKLNKKAALLSASYGRYQIMGFNHESAGYSSVDGFVKAMFEAERNHLLAFIHFIKASPTLSDAIKSHDWKSFAYHYNGPGYAKNKYDEKMKLAYSQYTQG